MFVSVKGMLLSGPPFTMIMKVKTDALRSVRQRRENKMSRVGFDNDKYIKMQSEHILERINSFGGKLYLEFGGKLFDDFHASRVLPGFEPDSKIRMLAQMKEDAEIVIVINAGDIEKAKVRGDLGITYDMDVLRLIDAFRGYGLYVGVRQAQKLIRKSLKVSGSVSTGITSYRAILRTFRL